jgi:hypothetical protein
LGGLADALPDLVLQVLARQELGLFHHGLDHEARFFDLVHLRRVRGNPFLPELVQVRARARGRYPTDEVVIAGKFVGCISFVVFHFDKKPFPFQTIYIPKATIAGFNSLSAENNF